MLKLVKSNVLDPRNLQGRQPSWETSKAFQRVVKGPLILICGIYYIVRRIDPDDDGNAQNAQKVVSSTLANSKILQ